MDTREEQLEALAPHVTALHQIEGKRWVLTLECGVKGPGCEGKRVRYSTTAMVRSETLFYREGWRFIETVCCPACRGAKAMGDDYAGLSEGIRDLVVSLNEIGFDTVDSGDGSNHAAGMECAVPGRMVAMVVARGDAFDETDRLAEWLKANPLDWPAYTIQMDYNPVDGIALVTLTEILEEDRGFRERLTGVECKGLV